MAGFVAAFLEFCQQFFLLGSEIGGSFDDGSYVQITAFRSTYLGYPFISKTEDFVGLGTGGDFQPGLAFESWYLDFTAEGGLGETDGYFAKKICSFSFKDGVILNSKDNVEIPVRASVAAMLSFSGKLDP
jgi:hypothetical protein